MIGLIGVQGVFKLQFDGKEENLMSLFDFQ